MMKRWFERSFSLGLSNELLPMILERLRGTPLRLEQLVASTPSETLTASADGSWSIQTNVGHLFDLEPLWLGRVEDLIAGTEELRPADLTNKRSHDANHDERAIQDLLAAFREERRRLVERVERCSAKELGATALHPRLKQPMGMADLLFFVAEHDDQHLARIRELLGPPSKGDV